MEICNLTSCTGCGMCFNLCPVGAITMQEGENDFVFPIIHDSVCIKCNQCVKKCPANQSVETQENVKFTYAAWNKDKTVRKRSSSGGVFSAFAKQIIIDNGIVVGVAMQELEAKHIIVSDLSELVSLNGSKYVQSETGNIYKKVKEYLEKGKKVLFSGSPCQIHAIKQFLGKDYDNLFLIDVICHGVPSKKMLHKHLKEVAAERKVKDIKFRYKDPYWDYSFVRIIFDDKGKPYQRLTVDDDYFHLFNIGFSIRQSCHECHYTSTHRQGDITLADYWGYRAHNFKMSNYLNGISLLLVNSKKGEKMLDAIKHELLIELGVLENAKLGNKSLSEPYRLPDDKLAAFWYDYNNGMSISELSKKHYPKKFSRPSHMWLRHMKQKYFWIVKKPSEGNY